MSNVVDLRHIVLDRLNGLEPHSRKRAGYVDLLRYLNTKEMREAIAIRDYKRAQIEAEIARMREADGFTVMLADALSEAFAEGV